MSKRLRTSFNQFVREKVIQGVDNMYPEAQNMRLDLLVPDVEQYEGFVEYQETNHEITGSSVGNFFIQGPMGYGPPPAGPGTEPFKCFLSNKVLNASASDIGAMTGDPAIQPQIKLGNIHNSGVGCTFAVGMATQYRYTTDPAVKVDKNIYDKSTTQHALVTIHGLGTTTTATHDPQQDIKFMYNTTSETGFNLSVIKGDGTLLVTPQNFNHVVSAYSRMMPVHLELKADGTGEFRVDNAKILFDVVGLGYVMPTEGTLAITIAGLDPKFTDGTVFGMRSAISRLTNVAVNDNNTIPCPNDIGLPPFIHGVSCTPIRKAIDPSSSDWEMPASVHDGMNVWTPFSENNPTVSYGLSAIMDNQTFDTRGVATSAINASLDIAIRKQTIDDRIDGAAVTDTIEAINLMAYNAATFDGSDFAVKIDNNTDWVVFPGLYDDPTIESHLTFYHKNYQCLKFLASDFTNDLVFKIRAEQSAPSMTFYYINEHPSGGSAYTYPLFASVDEAVYYEHQVGNPSSTTPVAMTFSTDSSGSVWYMPTTAHQQTYGLTPVEDGVVSFKGNTIIWNEIT